MNLRILLFHFKIIFHIFHIFFYIIFLNSFIIPVENENQEPKM